MQNNKLLMKWQGPFEIKEKVGSLDYRIELNGKRKTYHANILKKYVERDNVEKTKDRETICIGVVEDDDDVERGMDTQLVEWLNIVE